MAMRKGDKGEGVNKLQQQLLALGYQLPRFGADGSLGDETLFAIEQFKRDRAIGMLPDELPTSVSDRIIKMIADAAAVPPIPTPPNFFDVVNNHPHAARSTSRPFRTWKQLTGITIHQTASKLGESPARWESLHAHLGVTRSGKVIQVYNFTEVVNHANGLNFTDFGIEIDGWYEGIEDNEKTLWQPNDGPPRKAMTKSDAQISAVRASIEWIIKTVAANGGKVKYIHPHRQASSDRRSDPGSMLWREVGRWSIDNYGLDDGGIVDGKYRSGKSFKLGSGLVIPEEWDPRYIGNRY